MNALRMIHDVLALGVPFSVALLLAALGENFNQRAGVFNLGCEGIMSMGAFVGFLPAYLARSGSLGPWADLLGFALAALAGVLLGLLFGLVTVTFRAPQGIAGIGLVFARKALDGFWIVLQRFDGCPELFVGVLLRSDSVIQPQHLLAHALVLLDQRQVPKGHDQEISDEEQEDDHPGQLFPYRYVRAHPPRVKHAAARAQTLFATHFQNFFHAFNCPSGLKMRRR